MIPYNAFARHLKENKIIASPAELHGHLSGMLVVNIDLNLNDWLQEVLKDYSFEDQPDPISTEKVLQAFYEYVSGDIKSENYSFQLLLPDDNSPLSMRLEAMALWCQSFMVGLAFAGLKSEGHLPKEVKEFLEDLDKISKVDTDVDETQGEEADFVELTEYLKAGVITLYEEFKGLNDGIHSTIQ